MKKLAAFLAALTGLTAALAIGAHAAEPVDVVNIPEKAVTVDGVIADGEWDGATRMVLNISDTSTWSEYGAGIVGTDGWSQLGHTDDDFTTELAFTVDGEDLYILLTRKDSTLNFATDNYHRPYSSDCALMWFYDTDYAAQYGLQLLAANKSGEPVIGYFFMDSDQNSSDNLMELEYASAVTTVTADSYVMEAKVNMKGMDDFSHELLAGGTVKVTWCAVNICEEGWDSDDDQHVLWGTYNYQAQYKGVNDWENAPDVKVVGADEVPYAPVGEVSVPYATPEIDGVLSEGEYPESGKVTLNKAQGNLTALGWVGEVPAENSIDLYCAWDKDNFYLAGNVTDPAFEYSEIGQYNMDAFQVSLNIANVFKTDEGFDRAIFYSWGLQEEGTIDVIRQESANNDTIFEVGKGQKTDTGWCFEVPLSLEMLAEDAYLKGGEEAIPEPGMPIGGLFCYLDHDDIGSLINAFGTSSDEVMGWDPDAHGITFMFAEKEGADEPAGPTELLNKSWDNIFVNGEMMVNGGADAWLAENPIGGEISELTVRGWAYISTPITGFAYAVDGGDAVKSADYIVDRPDVKAAISEDAEGFEIAVDVSGLADGEHTLNYYAIDANGELIDTTFAIPFTKAPTVVTEEPAAEEPAAEEPAAEEPAEEPAAESKGFADVTAAADGKNVITAYTFTEGTSGFGGEGAENLFDGDTATKFCTNEFPAEAVAELDGVYTINGFAMATANDNADWTISVSADGENWTELASGDDSFFEETNFTYYVGDASAEGVSYVKFNAAGTASGTFQVSELTLFGDKTADAAAADAEPVDEAMDDKAEAPQTFDFGIIAAVTAVISLAGFASAKKKH